VAADPSGRAPLRSDPGAAAGAESSGQLEADRRQPRQARAKSRSALPGAAAIRLLAADPVARRPTRADPRADGSVRRRDGASTLRAIRARTARRRPCSRRRPDPTRVRERASQAHEDGGSADAPSPCRESRSRRSTSYARGRTVRCSSRTPTAATLTSATSTRSRSRGPWTLGGRRPRRPQSRTATRFPGSAEATLGGRWTLGGRRCPKPSLRVLSEGAD
jgi:hypothetical protein